MFLCTYKNVRIRRITHSKEIDWQLLSGIEGWKGTAGKIWKGKNGKSAIIIVLSGSKEMYF